MTFHLNQSKGIDTMKSYDRKVTTHSITMRYAMVTTVKRFHNFVWPSCLKLRNDIMTTNIYTLKNLVKNALLPFLRAL